jgi:hypothetical protein
MNGYNDDETIKKCKEWLEWIENPDFLRELYFKYKDNPMIRFKGSFKKDFSKL